MSLTIMDLIPWGSYRNPITGANPFRRPTFEHQAYPIDRGLLAGQEALKIRSPASREAYDKHRTSMGFSGPDRVESIGYTPRSLAEARETPVEDRYDKILRMMFLQQLMAGAAGDDPPHPSTARAGPRQWQSGPLNMYGRGPGYGRML